jgi:hypothetical protein
MAKELSPHWNGWMEGSSKKDENTPKHTKTTIRWSKTIGAGWNSWWMDVSTARLLTFIKHLNAKGIDQVCAEMQVRRLEKIRQYNKPALETIFRDEDEAESIGWEGTYIGRIW